MRTGLFLEEFEKEIGVFFFFFWIAFDEQGPVLAASRSSAAGGTAVDEAVGTQMGTFFTFHRNSPGKSVILHIIMQAL